MPKRTALIHKDMYEQIVRRKDERIEQLQQWVNDLHAGMYVNCVYCGHRYGPDESTPVAMADILREHIEQCAEHPLSKATKRIRELGDALIWTLPILNELCELFMDESWPEIKPATEYELMKMKNFANPVDQALTHGNIKITEEDGDE